MISSNSSTASESKSVGETIGHVVRDIITLAELQVQLFKSDASEVTGRVMRPFAVLTVGIVLLVATIPVCLVAIAEGLVATGLPRGIGYGLVAIVSLFIATGMALWAWRRFRAMPAAFARSRDELTQNIVWIKEVLRDVAAKPQPHDDLRNPRSNWKE